MVNLIKKIIIKDSDLTRTGSSKTKRDVTNFAEHCVTDIKNFTKVINGKETQVCFTPMTLRAALFVWMRCKKGYAVHRKLSVDVMPSQSLLKGIFCGNRVNEEGKTPNYMDGFTTSMSQNFRVTSMDISCMMS